MNEKKRQREKEGQFVKVPITDSYHTYARIIAQKFYAFYDCRTKEEISINEISRCPVLFTLVVHRKAVTSGRWKVVGILPLEERFKDTPPLFMQDIINPKVLHIYKDGEMIPATFEECKGLECFAVWESWHVEERLKNYYAGLPDPTTEGLKLREF